MVPLDWQAEPFSPMGGINGQGVLRQLGRPAMDWAELLIREAVQNSWDARLNNNKPVGFRIIGYELTKEQRSALRDVVLKQGPSNFDSSKISKALLLQDRNTWGLSGPLRADVVQASDDVPPNFVRFLRNVGQTHDTGGRATGGTYGFGKASYYGASACGTIAVYSRCVTGRKTCVESRFIAAQLGAPYADRGRQFTGRHWWGRFSVGKLADPLLCNDADEAAQMLGIPLFNSDETGTSILILDPIFSKSRPEEDLALLAEAAARSFWPKLSDGPCETATMTFDIRWENSEIPLPLKGHGLKAFRNAFRRAVKADALEQRTPFFWIVPIEALKPRKRLGTLVLIRFDDPQGAHKPAAEPDPFWGPCQHVAWMRTPHFVVKYEVGPPSPALQWAGVFIAAPDLDYAFARAEPPTHDAWNPQHLPSVSHERTYVKVALQRIKDAIRNFVTPSFSAPSYGSAGMPLGAFADTLGSLIPAVPGTGSRTLPPPAPPGLGGGGGGGVHGRRPQVRISQQRLILDSGAPAIEVSFVVESPGPKAAVSARAEVVLEDGSTEAEQPEGSERPHVLRWQIGDVSYASSPVCPEMFLNGAQGTVLVSCPEDTRTRITLNAEAKT